MNKMHKSKGITLVSLVITIILLLILASISIQALTNTGLFESAFKARKEAQRAQVTEWLNLKLMEVQMLKPTGTAEQIIEATRQNVIQHQDELKTMGKDVTIEETSTEEDGEQVEIYFYVIVDKDVFKVSLKEKGFIGELGKFPPVIKIASYQKTTNSITVQVTTKRNEGGELKYFIKGEDESEYQIKATKTDTETTHTFEELEQNKTYSIKIVAIAENKQEAEVIKENINLGNVPDLTVGDITFRYTVDGVEINENTWTNKAVTVTANTDEKGFTLQTKKDAQTWSSVKNQIFTENGQMHVRLWDGKNAGGAATANVTNIDTLAPNAFTPTTSSTTKSITVTASTTDAEATDRSGSSGIAGYRFKLDSGTWTDYQASGTYTWDDLAQTTDHTITVEAKDNAGNTTTGTVTKGTGTIEQPTTATYTPTTWTSGSVTVTLPTKTGYTIRYTTNGTVPTKTSTEYSGPFTVSSNCVITYIYTDGTNIGGSNTANITNIDTTKPEVTEATSTTNSISITATDDLSGIVGYAVTTSDTVPSESTFTPVTNTKTFSTTVTGKAQNTTYYVWVIDQVGHVSTSREIKTQIQYVTSIGLNQTSASLNIGSTLTLTATVNPSNANNKNVTWSSNNTSVATVSNGVVTAKTAGTATITATAQDGSGKSASCTVTVKTSDKVAPTTATTHTATAITYSWSELSTIAKMISNNSSIGQDTAEVNVTLNGTTKTIGVGDTATVDSQTVRILGFNHDTLTTSTAYGETTATGKAGISFEYVTFLTTAAMNSSNTNSGGWKDCALRTTLNGTTYNSLSIKSYIKQVQKEYIQTYNSASSKTNSSDYLWLLSCGEIWDNGYNGGVASGYAIAIEGSQYKYYKSTLGSTSYSSSTNITKKPNTSSSSHWWLRSPDYKPIGYFGGSAGFCIMHSDGYCSYGSADGSSGVAPGFSI